MNRPLPQRGAALAALALTACAVLAGPTAHAQGPAVPKQITMVVPFPPGGSNDVFARVVAEGLGSKLNTTVVVENRPGAGGAIGSEFVARAPADGSVLMLSSSTLTTNAAVQPHLKYQVPQSFAPVAALADSPMAVVVAADSPHRSLKDLLDAARKEPGKLNYGSAGLGSVNQMASEMLAGAAGVQFTHVPYKGMSPAMNDLAGGRVDFVIASFTSVSAMLRGQRIRVLAVTSPKRSPFYPDLPTVAETVPDYAVQLWWGVLAPAQTPPALLEVYNQAVRSVTSGPKLKQMFAEESAVALDYDVARFTQLVASDARKWTVLARERNITAQ
ncbi:twin-arginine translocation pathway signal protein [Bordetella genomosp. 5]|uniref:tripartite tricarboxylate transporter substrate binding protein n=1 Tax=Bordetella genomosp. 5 TaxID=1395608 RepID=UPI000B9EA4C7|nr:tripartite tricarboxylate transporter substrate binding protein [Bordetella genomosp. 5]OZI46089.1 twin-arginine translocation pathway signal protein [Bordetella genomosp. 5]